MQSCGYAVYPVNPVVAPATILGVEVAATLDELVAVGDLTFIFVNPLFPVLSASNCM